MDHVKSVCSCGSPVDYYWRDGPTGAHLHATVSEAKQALRESGAELNVLLEADLEAQIEDRLELAQSGRLVPVEHVKSVQRSPDLDMFEIRWTDIRVTRRDKVSWLVEPGFAHLRLYYVEEDRPWVVGIHVHEKIIVEDDPVATKDLQNLEIDEAIALAVSGKDTHWGVLELQI